MDEPDHIVLCEKHNPFPPDHGRAVRVVSLARGLRGLGFRVTLLVGGGESKTLPNGTRVHAVPLSAWPFRELHFLLELRRIDRELPVDVLQIQNDVFVLLAVVAKVAGFRVTYDAQVVEGAFWSGQPEKPIGDIVRSWVMPVCERLLCRLSERVSTLSADDALRLRMAHRLPAGKVFVVPLSSLRPTERPIPADRPKGRPIVLFLGSYAHRPNADAIGLIERNIRPKVLREVPEAVFQIVGKGLPVQALRAAGLEAFADVDEVTPFIDAATVCVAPVRVGSGVRTKLVEYMSRGKPVVALPPAIEGLGVRPGTDLIVANSVDSFSDSLITLLKDETLRRQVAISGYRRIREMTGEESEAKALRTFYPGKSAS